MNKTIVLQVKEVAYSASNNIMGESWEKDAACSGKIESGDSQSGEIYLKNTIQEHDDL